MQAWIDNGIAIIIAIQDMGEWLLAPMKFFSSLGTEQFFFMVLPFIYWSVDSALGIRLALIIATSNVFNTAGKILFAGPRPYWVSSHVQAFSIEGSFGIPSGHAQNAVGVWGTLAVYFQKKWLWVICVLMIFLIGFSRMYLGVHFLHDVLAGWILGIIFLWSFTKYWNQVSEWLSQKTFSQQALIIFSVSIFFILIGLGSVVIQSDFQLPEQWINNTLLVSDMIPAPVDSNGIFTSAGSFFGVALGVAWMNAQGGYQVTGPFWKRLLRYVIGLIGVLILLIGLGLVFPRQVDFISYTLRFIRYASVGFWITAGAPWVFKHFNLTTSYAPTTSV